MTPMPRDEPPSQVAWRRPVSRRQIADLVVHLARRQLESAHRLTLLGWLWPLARQLAQLVVLVFLFGHVLDLGIADFPVFVFCGLLVWNWFSGAVIAATGVLVQQRHLVFSPRLPALVLPLVAVAVPLVDLLMALPILLGMLAFEGRLGLPALLLPVLLAFQFLLTAGVALMAAAWNVYFRDVQNVVTVGLLLLFYMSPVFYGLRNVPDRLQWVLQLNPLTALIQAVRAVLFEGGLPTLGDVAVVAGTGVAAAALGLLVFRRLEPDFVDEL